MVTHVSHADRFRKFRERAGLTVSELAERTSLSEASVFDLESFDDELNTVYGPSDLTRFAAVLGVSPADLLGIEHADAPVTPDALAAAIRGFCTAGGVTVAAFEDMAGWSVAASLDHPDKFLHEYNIDGIRDICRTLNIDWERFISGL